VDLRDKTATPLPLQGKWHLMPGYQDQVQPVRRVLAQTLDDGRRGALRRQHLQVVEDQNEIFAQRLVQPGAEDHDRGSRLVCVQCPRSQSRRGLRHAGPQCRE